MAIFAGNWFDPEGRPFDASAYVPHDYGASGNAALLRPRPNNLWSRSEVPRLCRGLGNIWPADVPEEYQEFLLLSCYTWFEPRGPWKAPYPGGAVYWINLFLMVSHRFGFPKKDFWGPAGGRPHSQSFEYAGSERQRLGFYCEFEPHMLIYPHYCLLIYMVNPKYRLNKSWYKHTRLAAAVLTHELEFIEWEVDVAAPFRFKKGETVTTFWSFRSLAGNMPWLKLSCVAG